MSALKNIAGLVGGTKLSKWLCASAAAAAFALPAAICKAAPPAWHNDRDDHHDLDRRGPDLHDNDRDHGGFGLNVRFGGGPRYVNREVRVWVPAVYRTECEQVWVPDVFEDRTVQFRGGQGRLRTRIEHVLVTPGHYESREHQVLVCDGHYETHVEHVRLDDGDIGFRIRS
jgi:hypothetical protein